MKNILLFLLMLALMIPLTCRAQKTDSTKLVRIETRDGNQYIGTITFQDHQHIKLFTEKFGELTFDRIDVVSIDPVDKKQIKDGIYWFDNPQATRYFLTTNGYGLKRNESYYQNVWVWLNQFSYGVTDNFSFGVGFVPLFLFGGTSTPAWITPKFSIPISKDHLNLSIGAFAGTIIGEEDTGFGQLYGALTVGSRDKNFSVGLGYGYAGGELASTPTITLATLIRTGQRGYFISENYLIDVGDDVVALLSFGGRRLINRTALDFGLFLPVVADVETFIAIPWLGIIVPLNKR